MPATLRVIFATWINEMGSIIIVERNCSGAAGIR